MRAKDIQINENGNTVRVWYLKLLMLDADPIVVMEIKFKNKLLYFINIPPSS